MSVPVLDRKLVLESALPVADGAGGFSESWTALGTLWAAVEARAGRERGAAGGSVSVARYRITVRAVPVGMASRPRPGQRFRDGTRTFAIRAVSEADSAGRYLVCQTEEEAAT